MRNCAQMLYTASGRAPSHLYMLLIILLILTQDASFAANVHKVQLTSVPWYKERLLNRTSLGEPLPVVATTELCPTSWHDGCMPIYSIKKIHLCCCLVTFCCIDVGSSSWHDSRMPFSSPKGLCFVVVLSTCEWHQCPWKRLQEHTQPASGLISHGCVQTVL